MLKKIWISIAAFLFFFLFWELACLFYEKLAFVAPAPLKIFQLIGKRADRFLYHTTITLKEMAAGFAVAFIISFPLAWMMYQFHSLRLIMQPFFVLIQTVPIFALAPLMVIWFGWTFTAIIIPTALMIFFPLTMNIYRGLIATPQPLLDFFRINKATKWQTFTKLQLPWAAPHIFEGFRISAAISGVGAIAGEWAGAQAGLGLLMIESRTTADLEMMFGALFCLIALSVGVYALVIFAETVTFRNKSFTRTFVWLGALLTFTLTGCSNQTEKQGIQFVLDWVPNPNHVPFYVGVEKGFFKKNGIDLNILKVHDCLDAVPLLTSGRIDLALTYMPHAIHAISRGAPIKPIGILIDQPLNSFIFRSDEQIKTMQDLNGKRLGYSIESSNTDFLNVLLQSNEISFDDMHNVSFDLISTLGTGKVDVIYGAYWNIECENLRALGIETDYFSIQDFGVPPYYELIVLARNNSSQDTEEFMHHFQNGLQDSIDFCTRNPDQAFDIYCQANPDKGTKTVGWEKEAWLKTVPILAKSQFIDYELWNAFKNWLVEKRLLSQHSSSS